VANDTALKAIANLKAVYDGLQDTFCQAQDEDYARGDLRSPTRVDAVSIRLGNQLEYFDAALNRLCRGLHVDLDTIVPMHREAEV
jgi:hypothetical protein